MKRHAILIVAFAGVLIIAASAHAETYYRFELYSSANIPLDKNFEIGLPQSTVPLHGSLTFSPGVRGGIRVGVDGVGHWGQDISYSFGTNAAKISVPSNGSFAFTSRSHQFAYNAVLYPGGLRAKKVYPYLTAGAGGTIFTLSQTDIDRGLTAGLGKLQTHNSFVFNAGGGIRVQFNDHYGLRLNARDWMSHPPRYGIPASSDDPAASVFPVNGIFHQIELSIGFVYCLR